MKAGWQTKPLGELCEFQRGLTYAKGDEVDISNNVVLRATNIDLTTNLLNFSELKYISDKVAVPDRKKVKKLSLMICTASGSKTHLGKVAYIDDDYDYAFGGFMGMITPMNGLVPKYLFHLMTSAAYKNFISELSDGANINNLKFDDLKKFQVPYPDSPEQQRIVGILDEAFDDIATAKAIAEKNLQMPVLCSKATSNPFSPSGVRGGWRPPWERYVSSLAVRSRRSQSFRKRGRPTTSASFRFVTTRVTNTSFISHALRPDVSATTDDVMIGRYGPPLFQILRGLEGAYNVALMKALPDESRLSRDFLFYFLKHSTILQYVIYHSERAAGQIGVTKETLEPYPIALPSPGDQQKVVERIIELEAETQRLESLYQRKLATLDALKKSLLHHAFTGQLQNYP